MAGSLSDYQENASLDALFGSGSPATLYLALFTATPSDSGGGTEVSGGSYARKSVTNNATNFPAAASGQKTLHIATEFAAATGSWGTVTSMGIFDAASSGNLLAWASLAANKTVASGDTVRFAADALAITLD